LPPVRRALVPVLLLAALALAAVFALRRAPARPRHLVLISIDTLRQDRLGAYGYPRPTSPALDALAARGVVFENAFSPCSWTVPSHVSLLTGLHPSRHGVRGRRDRIGASATTLAEWLQARGFETGAVVNSNLLDATRGFARGFDHFERVGFQRFAPAAPEVHARALRWLEGRGERPFFLFLHHYDVHSDYSPAPEYRRMFLRPYAGIATGATGQLAAQRLGRLELGPVDAERLSDLYDAEIRQLDDELGRFFAELERRGVLRETAVIVTSDHGEEFLEHGGFLHGRTLHGELVRVPLVLAGPGIPAGRRVASPASLEDVLPTAASLLGVDAPAQLDGVDLSASFRGGPEPGRERTLWFETDWWLEQPEGSWKRAVQQGRWKLHYGRPDDRFALYDLATDPGERTDLAAQQPERLAELRALLEPQLGPRSRAEQREELSPEEIEQLRELGYLE
jgi:arylsulfatase A-like enzyme